MKKYFYSSIVLLVLSTLLFGLVYPLSLTVVGNVFWKHQAQGSMMTKDNAIIGSELIGQAWQEKRYFYGRNSASNYDPYASGASNLSPIHEKIAKNSGQESELNSSSGSGLDPHISPESAYLQVPNIARALNLPEVEIIKIVQSHVEGKTLGFMGQERVNVLKLNLMLDALK